MPVMGHRVTYAGLGVAISICLWCAGCGIMKFGKDVGSMLSVPLYGIGYIALGLHIWGAIKLFRDGDRSQEARTAMDKFWIMTHVVLLILSVIPFLPNGEANRNPLMGLPLLITTNCIVIQYIWLKFFTRPPVVLNKW